MADYTEPMATSYMPEAPLSIHIDAYYKGFHTGVTIRKTDNSSIPVTSVISAIDSLIEKGFKPSWNEETNAKVNGNGKPVATEQVVTVAAQATPQHMCIMHNVIMKERQGKHGVFYSHATQMDNDWVYCKGEGWGK